MIEVTATVLIPGEDEDKWGDRRYREGLLRDLASQITKNILDRMTVRRVRDVSTRSIKIEARLLIYERESAVGGRMPTSLADVLELEKMKQEEAEVKAGAPVVQVAMRRVITMPDKKGEGR